MEYFLGDIVLFPYSNFTPMDWMPCEGQILQIQQYSALYSLIGFNFGGNGTTTFALPDLRNAIPLNGMKYFIAISGIYPTRD